MHAMNSGGSRNLRGVWRDLLPAGYCPVSCPRIFCLIMSVQRFRLGFDIVIFSSDWNLQHNIRGTKLLHLSQTEYPLCFINGMNFVSKWGSWDIYVVWSVPSLARWRIFPKSFVFQILNMIDTTLLGPGAGLKSETAHVGPITTEIQGGVHQSGRLAEPRALIQALWHGI